MTSELRKMHKFIWLVLLFVVPTIMFLSIKDLNLFALSETQNFQSNIVKKASVKSAENETIKASVFDNQLEVILKRTLKNPSSIVYEMDKKGKKATLIGQLTTAGVYTFDINNRPSGIIIYDALKQVEITKLSF